VFTPLSFNMDISLDSVATHLWHGGTFKYDNQKFTRASIGERL